MSVEGVGKRREREENGEMGDRLGWEESDWGERGRGKKARHSEERGIDAGQGRGGSGRMLRRKVLEERLEGRQRGGEKRDSNNF